MLIYDEHQLDRYDHHYLEDERENKSENHFRWRNENYDVLLFNIEIYWLMDFKEYV